MMGVLLGNLQIRLVVLILTILVPALGLIFYTTSREWFNEKEHAQADALRVVNLAASRHEQTLETTRQLLVTLSSLPEVQKGDAAACKALFAGLKGRYAFLAWIGAADADGNILYATSPEDGSAGIPERSLRQLIRKESLPVGYYIPAIAEVGAFALAQEVSAPEGMVRSVIVAVLDPGWFKKLAAQCDLPSGTDLTLIDSVGTIQARQPDPGNLLGTSIADSPLARTIIERKQGVAEAPGSDGIERLNAFVPVTDASGGLGYLNVGIPLPVAYEEAGEAIPRGMIGAIFLLLTFAAWYLGDALLLRRIVVLKETARSLASGDMTVRTGVGSSREDIGDLMRSFDEMADSLHQQQEELRGSQTRYRLLSESIIGAMAYAVESRDPYTAGHQRRVSEIACAIARELGLAEERVEGIRMAGMVHDVGKIAVPAEILSRPGKLDETEFFLIRRHAQTGFDIMKLVEFPWPIARVVHEHHERMDGSGYPNKLKGEEILLESRILAVADVVEAIASHRPYRASLGLDVALEEITKGKGTAYDSEIVDACGRLAARGDLHRLIKL